MSGQLIVSGDLMDAVNAQYRLGEQLKSLVTKLGQKVPVGFTGTARLILIERGDQTGDDIAAEFEVNDSDDGDPDESYEHLIAIPYDVELHQLLTEEPAFSAGGGYWRALAQHIDKVTAYLAVMEGGLS